MRLVSVEQVKPGTCLAKSIYDSFGRVLLQKGTLLSSPYIKRLQELQYRSIYIVNENSDSIEIDDVVSAETRAQVFKITKEALDSVKTGDSIQERKIKQAVDNVIDEILRNRETIIHLTDIRSLQDHTFSHSVNVCILSVLTGFSMGYNQLKVKDLGVGALLHDIGKAKILEQVNSESRLTKDNYLLIQKHCEYGWEVLKKTNNISVLAAHVAWQHHERYDGTGYPRKLAGKGILEFARIVAVADVYDALANDRPYRDRMLPHEVIEFIRKNQGAHFDPDIVEAFTPNIAPFPIGSIVLLNSGFKCVVVSVNKKNPTRPKVKLLYDKSGRQLENSYFFDLMTETSHYITEIVRSNDTF